MPDPQAARLDLGQIVKRFPSKGALIRRLALKDKAFREICEDYLAACSSLAFFEASAPGGPEVSDFRQIIDQLAQELAAVLAQHSPPA
jgi:hypothetical protein